MRRELEGHRLGEAHDAELGGHVVGEVGDAALLARHRGDVDDHAARAAADHDPGGGLAAQEDALQVDGQGAAQVFRGDVDEAPHLGDAGVGDPDVDRAVPLRHALGDGPGLGGIGNVEGQGGGVAAEFLHGGPGGAVVKIR